MSLFKKIVKGTTPQPGNINNKLINFSASWQQSNHTTVNCNENTETHTTPTNNSKSSQLQQAKLIVRLEEQVRILNTYIKELAKENEMLQDRNSDMKTTLQQNKQLLDDYINNIGENDQLVLKLKEENDNLRRAISQKEEQIRAMNNSNNGKIQNGATSNLRSMSQVPSGYINKNNQSPKNNLMTTQFTTQYAESNVTVMMQGRGVSPTFCQNCNQSMKTSVNEQLLKKQKEIQKELDNLKQELTSLIPEVTVLSTRRQKQSPTHKIHTLSQFFQKAPSDEDYSLSFQKMLDDSDQASLLFQDKKGQYWEIVKKKATEPAIQNNEAGSSEEDYNEEDEEEEEYDSEGEDASQNNAQQKVTDQQNKSAKSGNNAAISIMMQQQKDFPYMSQNQRAQVIKQLQDSLTKHHQQKKVTSVSPVRISNQVNVAKQNKADKNVIVSVLNTEEN